MSLSQPPEKASSIDDAEDAVVVVLDFALEPLAGFEDEGIERVDDGRALVADVAVGAGA